MTHGLDWTRMGAARGIAGSGRPEEDGVFLSRSEFDVGYFVETNNTGGPVDVWAVDGIDEHLLATSGNGYEYYPAPVPPQQLTLVKQAAEPAREDEQISGLGDAYRSRMPMVSPISDSHQVGSTGLAF
ncbi:MAG: hypothetical protein QOG98_2730 [Pseudonocardiales bacterium]|nr:hypothetical protein [Pseudonocardiales bacterium]